MSLKLTDKEIRLLDSLCEKWESNIEEANRKLLLFLYESKEKVSNRYANFKCIEWEKLIEDFVGSGKEFRDAHYFLSNICSRLKLLKLHSARIIMQNGTIVIVHFSGAQKYLVLTFQRSGKSLTYKAYRSRGGFNIEFARWETNPKKVPFTQTLARSDERIIGKVKKPPFVKEEYGGVSFYELRDLCNEAERIKLGEIAQETFGGHGDWHLANHTYNPATKRIYRVDVV